jgi:hypothetical protein
MRRYELLTWPDSNRHSLATTYLSQARMTVAGGTSGSGQSAVHRNDAPNVADGSKAALTAPKSDFSFTPERWGNRPAQLVDS